MPLEPLGKVRKVLEAEIDRHFLDSDVGLPQAALGVLDAESIPELVGCGFEVFSEKSD
jgi:hypothetical protein